MTQLAELEIPAKAEFVSLARLVVSTVADDRYDLSDEQLDNLKLAISEACVMAIDSEHASENKLSLNCIGYADHLEVVIGTVGALFDAESVPDPDRMNLEQALGLPLIGSLVDEAEVAPNEKDGGSSLRMKIYCERALEL